jgi:hypothetical protein
VSRNVTDEFRDAVWASDLPPSARLLLLAMSRHCTFETGSDCRPGVTRLMADTGLSKRTILRLWDELTEDPDAGKPGWLRLLHKGSSKPVRLASVYKLVIPNGVTTTPVTGAMTAPVDVTTGAMVPPTGATTPPDWCHGGTPPPTTTYDHLTRVDPRDGAEVCARCGCMTDRPGAYEVKGKDVICTHEAAA